MDCRNLSIILRWTFDYFSIALTYIFALNFIPVPIAVSQFSIRWGYCDFPHFISSSNRLTVFKFSVDVQNVSLILKAFQYFIDIWWKIYCSRLYSGSDGGLSSLLSDGDVATFLASCCDMHVSLSRALYKLEFSRCRHSHMGMASSTDG